MEVWDMQKKGYCLIFILLTAFITLSCGSQTRELSGKEKVAEIVQGELQGKENHKEETVDPELISQDDDNIQQISRQEWKKILKERYGGKLPQQWGEKVTGVYNRMDTNEKIIALTFDACGGGSRGDGYDQKLIDYLIAEEIPATLFISGRWLEVNESIVKELTENPLFDVENHGNLHKPLSVNGNQAYGVKGTESIEDVIDEILLNEEKIMNITGKKPKYFRSGTAYYDEIAVKIVQELGYKVVNYSVLGDAGATFNKNQIKRALVNASPGAIVLFHMNRPETEIAEGIMEAIPELKKRGYRFVKLRDYDSILIP